MPSSEPGGRWGQQRIEVRADAELRTCQAPIRDRTRLSDAALAEERVDLWSLTG
jgi:hypothetical protein